MLFASAPMGGKDVAAAIRKLNKGKKPNEPVFDASVLPPGSIAAVDLSTILVPYIKSDECAAQMTAVPKQSCTSICDRLECMYLQKIKPFGWLMVLVVDGTFKFKDEVVQHLRNKTKESGSLALASIRASRRDRSLLKKLRRAEKACVSVTCDVVANVLEWCNKRPDKITVRVRMC